jgi:hypothetical protein
LDEKNRRFLGFISTRRTPGRPQYLKKVELITDFRSIGRLKSEFGVLEKTSVAMTGIPERPQKYQVVDLIIDFQRMFTKSQNSVGWQQWRRERYCCPEQS